jgi:ATP/maltotriose-dependent transcriptional regulator MalT
VNLPHLYRRRLINLLNEPATQTVYIFGPVGFGKSQLVRQWAETQDIPTIFFEGFSTPNAAELFTSFVEALISGLPKL